MADDKAPRDQPRRTGAARDKPKDFGGLVTLLEGYALVYGSDVVYDLARMMPMRVNALRLSHGHDNVKMWLASPDRRMVERVVFDPAGQVGPECLNLFRGFAVEPQAGDVKPWLELLHHLCSASASTPEGVVRVMAWVLRWLALPLQRPGAKMATAMVVHGPEGSGKNLLFEVYASLYGEHAAVVGQDQLESQFNDWQSAKQFVIGDEVVSKQELRHFKGKLKALVTSSKVHINTKMLPLRAESNHCNFVFLSNELQPLALDDGDRRYLVLYTPPPREREFYGQAAQWAANGGAAALMHHLLALDLGDFNEHTPPPGTTAKAELVELGLSSPERFWREWSTGLLDLPIRPCTVEQAYRAFTRWCARTGVRMFEQQPVFSRALKRACAGSGAVIKVVQVTPGAGSARTSLRCLIPAGCGAPDGQSEGRWMADAMDSFQHELDAFSRSDAAPG